MEFCKLGCVAFVKSKDLCHTFGESIIQTTCTSSRTITAQTHQKRPHGVTSAADQGNDTQKERKEISSSLFSALTPQGVGEAAIADERGASMEIERGVCNNNKAGASSENCLAQ